MQQYEIKKANLKKHKEVVISLLRNDSRGISENIFEWKYYHYPYTPPSCLLIKNNQTGEFVGMGSLFQRIFSINNKLVRVGTLGDLIVKKEYRTFFPAIKLEKDLIAQSSHLGYKFIYSYSTNITAKIFESLSYQKIGTYKQLIKPIKTSNLVKKFFPPILQYIKINHIMDFYFNTMAKENRKKIINQYKIDIFNEFDDRFDKLFDYLSKRYKILGDRRSRFMNWRYTQDPRYNYNIFCLLEKNNELIGYLVFLYLENSYYINDICAKNDNILDILLYEFCYKARKEDIELIRLRYMGNNNMLNKLKNYNFYDIKTDREILIFSKDQEKLPDFLDHSNWQFFTGDKNV